MAGKTDRERGGKIMLTEKVGGGDGKEWCKEGDVQK